MGVPVCCLLIKRSDPSGILLTSHPESDTSNYPLLRNRQFQGASPMKFPYGIFDFKEIVTQNYLVVSENDLLLA